MQRFLAFLLTIALLLSGLTGCGKQEIQLPEATAATGRYVESEIPLPIEGYPGDMVLLSDGRLRVGMITWEGAYKVFTREPSGDWTEDVTLPDSIREANGDCDLFRLSPDGSALFSFIQDKGDGTYA